MIRSFLLALFAVSLCSAVTIEVDTATTLLDSSNFTAGTNYFAVFQLTGNTGLSNQASLSSFNFGGGSVFARDAADPVSGTFGLGPDAASTNGIGQSSATLDLSVDPVNSYALYSQRFTAGNLLRFDVVLTSLFAAGIPDQFAFQLYDSELTTLLYEVALDLTASAPVPEPTTLALTAGALATLGLTRLRRTSMT
jgi:hypothetical protein